MEAVQVVLTKTTGMGTDHFSSGVAFLVEVVIGRWQFRQHDSRDGYTEDEVVAMRVALGVAMLLGVSVEKVGFEPRG